MSTKKVMPFLFRAQNVSTDFVSGHVCTLSVCLVSMFRDMCCCLAREEAATQCTQTACRMAAAVPSAPPARYVVTQKHLKADPMEYFHSCPVSRCAMHPSVRCSFPEVWIGGRGQTPERWEALKQQLASYPLQVFDCNFATGGYAVLKSTEQQWAWWAFDWCRSQGLYTGKHNGPCQDLSC